MLTNQLAKRSLNFKVGETVALYWDGKWGRRVDGVVVKKERTHHITIRFKLWLSEETEVEQEYRFRIPMNGRARAKMWYRLMGWARNSNGELSGYYRISKWIPNDQYPWPDK